jgi:hypothetical protein
VRTIDILREQCPEFLDTFSLRVVECLPSANADAALASSCKRTFPGLSRFLKPETSCARSPKLSSANPFVEQ